MYEDMYNYVNEQKKLILEEKRKALNNLIQTDYDTEEDPKRRAVLKLILSIPSGSERDYDTKYFIYNNGIFRTKEEVEKWNEKIEQDLLWEKLRRQSEATRKYIESGQYDEDCKQGRFTCWLPFLINVGLFLLCLLDPYSMFNFGLFLLFISPVTLTITVILMNRHARHVQELSDYHNVSHSHPNYQNAVNTERAAKLGLIASAASAYHTVSKETKSMLDPDSWNVLK